jgi:hypothetical protein
VRAFKYRYTIIHPAQKPRQPVKPKPKLVLGASLIAGLALALLSTTVVDLRSRKLLESWQVERILKLPLIGEVRSASAFRVTQERPERPMTIDQTLEGGLDPQQESHARRE